MSAIGYIKMNKRPFPVIPAGMALLGIGLGVGLGVLIPKGAPDSCITALDRHQAQYTQLEAVLPVAADAVGAAVRRSVSGLDSATDRINTIKGKLQAGQGPLQQASDECRGTK
jgi:hypothetical protein